jgi:hypothetical protein
MLEWLATSVFDRWQYANNMWTVPGIGIGLLPMLQWVIVPGIILLTLRRLWER